MGKILPVLLAMIGLGAGVGAGIVLRPAPSEVVEINPCGDVPNETKSNLSEESSAEEGAPSSDFVKMNNQFVIPVLGNGQVRSLVVLSLSLEIAPGSSEEFYQREPKLRDAFLQVLFDHANLGGFDGVFTEAGKLDGLRLALTEVAEKIMTTEIFEVLVTDIVRQDI
ncbi:flagellar basal body-associated FliL family protein [Aliiroseovarius crassostreae]|uniref:flagellar basal body-associated FliL family protein n=1 Tax=Aliiroseovarius crassostreae TaxID=154981 RepID=UPI00220DA2AE|nr:flagellar basal body-associated FliL family protein [Aliiroseovarius crassostreae]UWQ08007.1 flagellar basal body-associated FliL family protein [Aliiroseovarius crassostreae]UWQ11112.1 flagellar basal body-associated FliL family protein [Aliiroseovarius crassostreae]